MNKAEFVQAITASINQLRQYPNLDAATAALGHERVAHDFRWGLLHLLGEDFGLQFEVGPNDKDPHWLGYILWVFRSEEWSGGGVRMTPGYDPTQPETHNWIFNAAEVWGFISGKTDLETLLADPLSWRDAAYVVERLCPGSVDVSFGGPAAPGKAEALEVVEKLLRKLGN